MPRVKTISDEDVLDRALDVLLARGPQGATLPAIGAAAALSPSTLIQRFGSKAGLMERVFERAATRLAAEVEALPEAEDPREALLGFLVGQSRAFRTPAHMAGHLSLLIEDLRDPTRRAAAQVHVALLRSGIADRLAAMGSPTPVTHALQVEAMWSGAVLQWALEPEPPALESWLRLRIGPLLALIAPPA